MLPSIVEPQLCFFPDNIRECLVVVRNSSFQIQIESCIELLLALSCEALLGSATFFEGHIASLEVVGTMVVFKDKCTQVTGLLCHFLLWNRSSSGTLAKTIYQMISVVSIRKWERIP